jgi:hypothetical protein
LFLYCKLKKINFQDEASTVALGYFCWQRAVRIEIN